MANGLAVYFLDGNIFRHGLITSQAIQNPEE